MQEWFNWLVSKTSVLYGTEGSNPSPSAKMITLEPVGKRKRAGFPPFFFRFSEALLAHVVGTKPRLWVT